VRSEEYVTIVARFMRRTAKAVLLAQGDSVPRGAWIPRSCIHGVDEKQIDDAATGQELTLRIFEWIAERKSFIW